MEALDYRNENGPFDFIGDVHGCLDELIDLFSKLGYSIHFTGKGTKRRAVCSPADGRRAVFVGDLVDRGPNSPDVLRIVMAMVRAGQAFCVAGNHDVRFLRWLNGRDVRVSHGLHQSIEQIRAQPRAFASDVRDFLDTLPSHIWLDDGAVVVAHAGISRDLIGTSSKRERHFCLYGDTEGGRDDYGLPIRYNWAAQYDGEPAVIYGHTPVPEPVWLNNTLCIDTGCVFGGYLSALRWPEREIRQVAARKAYAKKIRPFGHPPDRPADQSGA